MGVKSTVELSRKAAEEKYVELHLDELSRGWRRLLVQRAATLSDKDLEDLIEAYSDRLCGGESFLNYLIVKAQADVPCGACEGTGQIDGNYCRICNGRKTERKRV